MKKSVALFLAVFITIFAAFSGSDDPRTDDDYAARFLAADGNERALFALRDGISRDLETRPGDTRLLNNRLTVNRRLNDIAATGEDIRLLAEYNPESPLLLLQHCLFVEGTNPDQAVPLQCYRDVVVLFRKKTAADLPLNPDYVLTMLLAQLPEAGPVCERFTREAESSLATVLGKKLCAGFNRQLLFNGELDTLFTDEDWAQHLPGAPG